eukprot:g4021.t1
MADIENFYSCYFCGNLFSKSSTDPPPYVVQCLQCLKVLPSAQPRTKKNRSVSSERKKKFKTIWDACKADDVATLKFCISDGNSPDEPNSHGVTPLMICASNNSPKCLNVLLQSGASTRKQDMESGWTALHRALYSGNYHIALVILTHNCKVGCELFWPKERDHDGYTAMELLSRQINHTSFGERRIITPAKENVERLALHLDPIIEKSNEDELNSESGSDGEDVYSKLCENFTSLREGKKVESDATFRGTVLSFGLTSSRALGTASKVKGDSLDKPISVHLPITNQSDAVRQVVAGRFHSVVLLQSGRVFAWGLGEEGRLGLGYDTGDHMTPKLVSTFPTRARVISISACEDLTMALMESGMVFTWGTMSDGNGSLASEVNFPKTIYRPRRVDGVFGKQKRAVAIACGSSHHVAICSEGDVYTWGCNGHCQLGYTIKKNVQATPKRVGEHAAIGSARSKRAVTISAASKCTCVVTETGALWQFGGGCLSPFIVTLTNPFLKRRGRRGGTSENLGKRGIMEGSGWSLQDLQLKPLRVIQVSCSSLYAAAVDSNGFVHVWSIEGVVEGKMSRKNTNSSEVGMNERKVKLPRVVDVLRKHFVVRVACQANCIAAITSTGTLYTTVIDGNFHTIHDSHASNRGKSHARVRGVRSVVDVAVGPQHAIVISRLVVPKWSSGSNMQEANLSEFCERQATKLVSFSTIFDLLHFALALNRPKLVKYCQTWIRQNFDLVLEMSELKDLLTISKLQLLDPLYHRANFGEAEETRYNFTLDEEGLNSAMRRLRSILKKLRLLQEFERRSKSNNFDEFENLNQDRADLERVEMLEHLHAERARRLSRRDEWLSELNVLLVKLQEMQVKMKRQERGEKYCENMRKIQERQRTLHRYIEALRGRGKMGPVELRALSQLRTQERELEKELELENCGTTLYVSLGMLIAKIHRAIEHHDYSPGGFNKDEMISEVEATSPSFPALSPPPSSIFSLLDLLHSSQKKKRKSKKGKKYLNEKAVEKKGWNNKKVPKKNTKTIAEIQAEEKQKQSEESCVRVNHSGWGRILIQKDANKGAWGMRKAIRRESLEKIMREER